MLRGCRVWRAWNDLLFPNLTFPVVDIASRGIVLQRIEASPFSREMVQEQDTDNQSCHENIAIPIPSDTPSSVDHFWRCLISHHD